MEAYIQRENAVLLNGVQLEVSNKKGLRWEQKLPFSDPSG